MPNAIGEYIREVQRIHDTGDATEHSYRSALEGLMESLGQEITAVNEPKRIACGAPDLLVDWRRAFAEVLGPTWTIPNT